MGYGIRKEAIFGVYLAATESAALIQAMDTYFKGLNITLDQAPKTMGERWFDPDAPCYQLATLSEVHHSNLAMVAEGINESIQDSTYEPGCEHTFGIFMGSSGYGSLPHDEANFKTAIRNPAPAQVTQDFQQYCLPILQLAGLTHLTPDVLTACYIA